MKKLFAGGIHPKDQKERSCKQEGLIFIDPDEVVIPLSQHIGVPCAPLVKVGDVVKMGQKIGDQKGLCVPVHASVSGTVTAIENRPHTNGHEAVSIVIKNDHQYTWHEKMKAQNLLQVVMGAAELFDAIREAGIVGMGGATFPTDVKARSAYENIDTLIINACECEPYITADDTLICMEPERVLKGISLMINALNPKSTVLAIEDNKQQAIKTLRRYLNEYPKIILKVLPTRYPQGAEKQLVKAVTGREIPPGQLPISVGCAVFNVSTTAAISQAIYEGIPLIRRIVTVTGDGIKNPQNFLVPIGSTFCSLVEASGGLDKNVQKVIAGGPLMGKAQSSLEVPVIKGTGAVLCLSKPAAAKSTGCIRCGKCIEVCPMNLQPLYLYRYEKAGDLSMLEKLHLTDCMECGCCSYTCPESLPLVEHFRAGKYALKEAKA